MKKEEKEWILNDLKEKIPVGEIEISIDDGPVSSNTFLNLKPEFAKNITKNGKNPIYNLLKKYGKDSETCNRRNLYFKATYAGSINNIYPINDFGILVDEDNKRICLAYVKTDSDCNSSYTGLGYWSFEAIKAALEEKYKHTLYAHIETRYIDDELQYKVNSFSRSRTVKLTDFVTLLVWGDICYLVNCFESESKKNSEHHWAFRNKGKKNFESMICHDIDLGL